jgi:hypothetical protein
MGCICSKLERYVVIKRDDTKVYQAYYVLLDDEVMECIDDSIHAVRIYNWYCNVPYYTIVEYSNTSYHCKLLSHDKKTIKCVSLMRKVNC